MFKIASRFPASWLQMFWLYLLWITLAELLTAIVNVQAGLVCHFLLMVALLVHTALRRDPGEQQLALALTLGPLTRLLSTTIPLLKFPQPAWYPIVTGPLLLATWLAVRQIGVPRERLGLRLGNWRQQLLLPGLGLGLGVLEYAILHPQVSVASYTWIDFALFAISLAIFTGFSEELIFRGVLQAVALPVMRRWALVYVALLFGVLHIGYLSVFDVLFVTAVGLLFAYIVRWGGSILGVTLAHGLTNITLFLIMPYLAGAPPLWLASVAPWVIGIGSLVGVLGIALIARTRSQVTQAAPDASAPAASLKMGPALVWPAVGLAPLRAETVHGPLPPSVGHLAQPRVADPQGLWESWRTATLGALLAEAAAGAAGSLVTSAPGPDGPPA